MSRIKVELLLVLVTLLWGGTFVLIKESLSATSPAAFVVMRFTLASVLGLIIWHRSLAALTPRLVWQGLLLGVLFGGGFLLQSMGLTETSATASAFITGTTVVFVPFMYRLIERRSVTLLNWVSTLAVLCGLYLFTQPERSGLRTGDVLTLLSAVGWAAYIVVLDVFTRGTEEDQQVRNLLVVMQFVVTAVTSAIAMLITESAAPRVDWSTSLVLSLLYCAILATVLTTWLQTNVQRHTHPVRAGVIFSLEPIFASIIALFSVQESWTMRQGAGAGVLLAAVIIPDVIMARREQR